MARTVLQLTRLTNSGRLTDRYLACQVREVYDESGDRGMSRLLMLVEINRPWLTASQIGQALMHAFTTGYREESEESDDVKRVEAALKRVNETLVHLTQQGESEWIGHLHAVFVVEINSQIHVAHTGRAGAFLARDGALSRVTELEGTQSAATANRTFANITSGAIQNDDSFLIASSDFLRAVPTDTIEETLADRTPAEAAGRFARVLRQHQTKGAAAIVVRAYDSFVLESQPLIPEPDVLYLDQEPGESFTATLQSIGRHAKKLAFAARQQFGKASQRANTYTKTSLAPKSRELAEKSRLGVKNSWTHLTTVVLPGITQKVQPVAKRMQEQSQQLAGNVAASVTEKLNQPPKPVADTSPDVRSVAVDDDKGLIGKDLYTVRYYNDRSKGVRVPFTGFTLRVPILRWEGAKTVVAYLQDKRRRPRVYLATAVILLLLLSINIYVLRAKQTTQLSAAQANAAVTTLQQQYDTIKLQLTLKKTDQSGPLNDILNQLQPLEKNSAVSDRATQLANAVQDTLDAQTNTVHVRNPKTVATFSNANGLWRLSSDVVTTQSDGNQIFSSPIAGQLIDDQAKLPDGATALAGATLDQSHNLALLTKGGLEKMTQPGKSPTAVSVSGSWEQAVAMSSFGDNLYLLDANGNQIWKHVVNGDSYGAGTAYVADGTSVGNGVSLAIDGSVYVLTSDGSIKKLTRGRADNFTVQGLPSNVSLTNARAIWTSEDANSMYVLTATSLVELSKTGAYSHAYLSDKFTGLSAFVVDATAKQAWVLNGSTVYQFDLTGA